jgi:hypothetical protein
MPFPVRIKPGLYLFVILSINDTCVVAFSQSVLSVDQSDWSTDTP